MSVFFIALASISAIIWLGVGLLFYTTMRSKPIFRYHYGNRYIDAPAVNFFIHPISALLYIGVLLNSMVKTLRRGGINWRGTFYSLKELRKHASF